MSQPTEPTANGPADLCRADGTTATFHAGLSGQTHHWTVRSPTGVVLAQTARVHRGGKIRKTSWKLWNLANMHDFVGPLGSRSGDFGPLRRTAIAHNVSDMSTATQSISILSASECWDLLSSVDLGRLVTTVDSQAEIFPINFAVQHRTILFRTAEGTKLVSAAINDRVLFEVDGHDAVEGWSVIVKGAARSVRTDEDIADAARAELLPWTATSKQHLVRIRPLSVTGRRFRFGPAPYNGPSIDQER